MKLLKEFLGNNSYNGLQARESLEWTNGWIDKANAAVDYRVLIIGDSTARMVRSTLAKEINCPVDMIGTSSAIDDELFINFVDSFFLNTIYQYDIIFVQLGHHGRIGKDGGKYKDSDYDSFKTSFMCLIEFLKQYSKNIVIETIFDAVKPIKKNRVNSLLIKSGMMHFLYNFGLKKETKDIEINNVTSHKNLILYSLINVNRGGAKLLDINDIMNRQNFFHVDHIHFERKAKLYIAKVMANQIKKTK